MQDLAIRQLPLVASLPAPSSSLAGVMVRLASDGKGYCCTGAVWVAIDTLSSLFPISPVSVPRLADLGSAAYADLETLVTTAPPVVITTATAYLAPSVPWVIVNYAGTCTLTLPDPSRYPGIVITIKTITANAVNSASSNVVPLAGGAAGTGILSATGGKWARLVSDGTSWVIMEGN